MTDHSHDIHISNLLTDTSSYDITEEDRHDFIFSNLYSPLSEWYQAYMTQFISKSSSVLLPVEYMEANNETKYTNQYFSMNNDQSSSSTSSILSIELPDLEIILNQWDDSISKFSSQSLSIHGIHPISSSNSTQPSDETSLSTSSSSSSSFYDNNENNNNNMKKNTLTSLFFRK